MVSTSTGSTIKTTRLVNHIQQNIEPLLENFIFEVNDVYTRSIIQQSMVTFFNGLQNTGSIYDFDVVCDSSNNSMYDLDTGKLNVDIWLKPTGSTSVLHMPVRINGEEAGIHIYCEDY